ncbi:hypothetical protein Tco_0374051 [Tanacetum coccineum]
MLVESDYESWRIRIERYIHRKPLGKLIWRSIQSGPTPHPQITVIEGQGEVAVQVTRDKRDEEFTQIENNKELADIQATNILSQGLPRHVFNILNQTRTGKEIWDNVSYLKKGIRKASFHQPTTTQDIDQSQGFKLNGAMHGPDITEIRTEKSSGARCKEKKRVKDSQYFKDKMLLIEAKEKGTVLDDEAEVFLADVECIAPYDQPLAITTTNMFEVSHEDAYDSDVDEGPHASAAFMANLSSTSGTNCATTCKLVQSLDENLVKEVTEFMRIFDELDTEYEQCVLEKKNLQIEKKNLLIQNECLITDSIAKRYLLYVLASDRDRPHSEELNNTVFEINQLKEQLQGKDDTIRKLQTKINNMSMLNVEPTVGSFDKQALETELTQVERCDHFS